MTTTPSASKHGTLAAHLYSFGLSCSQPDSRSRERLQRPPYLNRQQVADLLGVCRVTVHQWIASGKLPPTFRDSHGWPWVSLEDVLVIARNAIREGLAPALLAKQLPGPAPTKLAPR